MIRSATALAAVAAALLFVQAAEAQTLRNARYTSCRDAAGTRVVAVNTTRLNNVGMAGRVNGRPVILFNPNILRRFRPITRTFWFYHECAHHALGHSLGHRPMSRERDADCWAVRQMRQRGLLTAAGLRTIQRDLYPLNGDGHLYLPGPQRAAYVRACATGRRTAPPQMVQRYRTRPAEPRAGYRRFRNETEMRREPVRNRYDTRPREEPIAPMDRQYRYRGPSGGLR